MRRLDAADRLRAAEQLARIKQEQQTLTSLSKEHADAQANAGRAASRAGNSALPDEFRKEAKEEQQHFGERARKLRMEMVATHSKLDLLMADANPGRVSGLFILASMLPFAAGGLILLARYGSRREVFLAAGVLLALIVGYVALRVHRQGPGSSAMGHATITPAPKYSTVLRNDASVLLAHNDVDLHYVVFYAGKFNTSNQGSQNRHGLTWLDDGAIKLADTGRSFGLRRNSANDLFLTINGHEYDLRLGRLFVLRDDGTVEQRGVHPALEDARSLEKIGELARESSAAAALESSGIESDRAKAIESWTYTPRHLTEARLTAWIKSPDSGKAGWSPEISVIAKAGVFTVSGPREHVRRAATLLRVLDQPEVKELFELPLFNMGPDFFTKLAVPQLMNSQEFPTRLITDAVLDTLTKAGVSAPQLGRALSDHVLELEKAVFVNQGPPFESIMKSPGASTYYEAAIPCADRPAQPLTLRLQRTTQQVGTQSKVDGFSPWLIEEAKAIVIAPK
jgi:hypothetical protein